VVGRTPADSGRYYHWLKGITEGDPEESRGIGGTAACITTCTGNRSRSINPDCGNGLKKEKWQKKFPGVRGGSTLPQLLADRDLQGDGNPRKKTTVVVNFSNSGGLSTNSGGRVKTGAELSGRGGLSSKPVYNNGDQVDYYQRGKYWRKVEKTNKIG